LRLFSFGGYGLALAALALVVFGAIECPPLEVTFLIKKDELGIAMFSTLNKYSQKRAAFG